MIQSLSFTLIDYYVARPGQIADLISHLRQAERKERLLVVLGSIRPMTAEVESYLRSLLPSAKESTYFSQIPGFVAAAILRDAGVRDEAVASILDIPFNPNPFAARVIEEFKTLQCQLALRGRLSIPVDH